MALRIPTCTSLTPPRLPNSVADGRRRESLTATDAKVLHFNQPVKPWMPDAMLAWGYDPIPIAAFNLWYDAWMDCLAGRECFNEPGEGRRVYVRVEPPKGRDVPLPGTHVESRPGSPPSAGVPEDARAATRPYRAGHRLVP